MKRRYLLLVVAVGFMVFIAAQGAKEEPNSLLLLDWAKKANLAKPPVAILLEMGLTDDEETDWSGKATFEGAKVVHREGYRFIEDDKLIAPDAWKAKSHYPIRGGRNRRRMPQRQQTPNSPAGVVFHLNDVQDDAKISISLNGKDAIQAPLSNVIAGQPMKLLDGAAQLRLISTATPVVMDKSEDDFPAACYGPDGTLWLAYISYHNKEDRRRMTFEQIPEQPTNFQEYYNPEFGDQLFVKSYKNGKWSGPMEITGPNEDLMRCGIAAEGDGDVWVSYSANRKGNFDIYAREISAKYSPEARANPSPRPGAEKSVKSELGRSGSIFPSMVTDKSGAVWLAIQELEQRDSELHSHISIFGMRSDGLWGHFFGFGGVGPVYWAPALISAPSGKPAIAWDSSSNPGMDYDVECLRFDEEIQRYISPSSRSAMRPTGTYDPQGRLWIAYEEGPTQWGKDYGAFELESGNPLYNQRSVRVVCLVDGKMMKPVAELPSSAGWEGHPEIGGRLPQYEQALRYAYPKINIDGKGRVWITYRQKFGTRRSTHAGSYWITFARMLQGDEWSEPIEIHHSDGLLDHRPVLLPHSAGGLIIIHNTDGRFLTPENINNQIYMSYVDLPGEAVEPKLVAHKREEKAPNLIKMAQKEREDVKRIREYRIEAGNKKYQFLRGEFHRHTEISWDGGPDGSLEDMFRYAIDAAAMDWIGNGDHVHGRGREYSWWLTQKLTDAYHVPNAFTPMFTYERSVSYPHGHRNVMFAKRGVMTLPRLAPEPGKAVAGIHADDTKMLYRYLHEHDGICAVHTSATGMGTDWRDNDPVVEPIVEIYQGDRMSYEYEGTLRAGYDPRGNRLPANIGGWRPKGFIDNAFKKGYRLGFQASSDHWSTHMSYCIAVAESHDREAILDALKKRHCYGATDNIIVEFRSGDHIMGDEFATSSPPKLEFTVIGTQPIERIDILKDSKVVDSVEPEGNEHTDSWTDPDPSEGTHYYYIRVLQEDGEIAWASPMWIDLRQ